MQDGIIAGNGNSRYLKTVAAALSLYPDYESFMAALIAGTFPIDLNGINAGGWTQQGTPLNKANLFSDSTASALGLTASNTPNDALEKIKILIDAANDNANTKAQIKVVSYIGTGTTGQSNPVSVSADFPIKVAIWIADTVDQYATFMLNVLDLPTSNTTKQNGFNGSSERNNRSYAYRSSDYKKLSWWSYDDYGGLNANKVNYDILLIG